MGIALGNTHHYAYQYNTRSELTYATRNTEEYRYRYDNIGNRETASEKLRQIDYLTNPLNQYTRITEDANDSFVPAYDADGNQTLVNTQAGIWEVEYNAENRPVQFTLVQDASLLTRIECKYDYLGRRFYKSNYNRGGTVDEKREDHYLYRDYLLVQRTGDNVDYLNAYVWDPTEPVNTRLLYMVIPGPQFIFYGYDFNKNVTELFHYDINSSEEMSLTTYDYTPYGLMEGEGDLLQANPFCFSSEYLDADLDLVYYNYRHYNPCDGRWISRDPIEEDGGSNLYLFIGNNSITYLDSLGLELECPTQKNKFGHSYTMSSTPSEHMPEIGDWSDWREGVDVHTFLLLPYNFTPSGNYSRSRRTIFHGIEKSGPPVEANKGEEKQYSYTLTITKKQEISAEIGYKGTGIGLSYQITQGNGVPSSGTVGEKNGQYSEIVYPVVRYIQYQRSWQSKIKGVVGPVNHGEKSHKYYIEGLIEMKCKRCECPVCDE